MGISDILNPYPRLDTLVKVDSLAFSRRGGENSTHVFNLLNNVIDLRRLRDLTLVFNPFEPEDDFSAALKLLPSLTLLRYPIEIGVPPTASFRNLKLQSIELDAFILYPLASLM